MAPLPLVPLATPAPEPCVDCIAGCCRAFALNITGYDAWRIGRELQLPLEDFSELRFSEEADDDHRVVLDGRTAPAGRRHHRLLLRKVLEPASGFAERCVFLVTARGRGRCGIYASRPMMCRAYPAWFANGKVHVEAGTHCPPGSWALADVDTNSLGALLHFKRRQNALYRRLCDRWTEMVVERAEVRHAQEFLAYLVCGFDELLAREPSWFELAGEPEAPSLEALNAGVDGALSALGLSFLSASAVRPGGT